MSGMFSAARRVLRQEATSDNHDEWGGDRREAWDQLDRLESTLIMMRSGMDTIRPDAEMKDEREFWARHGQRTTIELIEKAIRTPSWTSLLDEDDIAIMEMDRDD